MKKALVFLRGVLWVVYRGYGLASFALSMAFAWIILKLEMGFVPRSEILPYFAVVLGMFCGTLFMVPSTTPHWVRHVTNASSAVIAVAAIVGLSVALAAGFDKALPTLTLDNEEQVRTWAARGLGLLTALGILSAGGLGLLSPKQMRRVPIMDLKTPKVVDPRSLRKSRV